MMRNSGHTGNDEKAMDILPHASATTPHLNYLWAGVPDPMFAPNVCMFGLIYLHPLFSFTPGSDLLGN